MAATFANCASEAGSKVAEPVANSRRSKSNQVVLSTGLDDSIQSISLFSTPSFGMLISVPSGNLRLNRSPNFAQAALVASETFAAASVGAGGVVVTAVSAGFVTSSAPRLKYHTNAPINKAPN